MADSTRKWYIVRDRDGTIHRFSTLQGAYRCLGQQTPGQRLPAAPSLLDAYELTDRHAHLGEVPA